MCRCHVCGKTEGQEKFISEVFDIDGKSVRVEHIPATVCEHRGEPVFSRATTEKVRRMVHGEAKPVKSVQMDVFAFR
ncbi:MAG: YgiT-type zinc finger domain-containing protein [Nitrospirae bacterium RIFCSPLOWO2_12_FULL_63_8]|nr:MAG: YgiT-type zinc finger domain-containing protein [Nitrospirae bacterium RIFCSPLOWO2_12_FULL_63_8]